MFANYTFFFPNVKDNIRVDECSILYGKYKGLLFLYIYFLKNALIFVRNFYFRPCRH